MLRLSSIPKGRDSTRAANNARGMAYQPTKRKLVREKRMNARVPSIVLFLLYGSGILALYPNIVDAASPKANTTTAAARW